MQWFGKSWGAPACDPEYHIETPAGAVCYQCDEGIEPDDTGVILGPAAACHLNCFLRTVFGSVDHQLGRCSCRGLEGDGDPPGLTRRQAADAAVDLFYRRNA